VSEPIVQRQGLDRINVQLPGVQNSAEVKDMLGKVATLEFRWRTRRTTPSTGRAARPRAARFEALQARGRLADAAQARAHRHRRSAHQRHLDGWPRGPAGQSSSSTAAAANRCCAPRGSTSASAWPWCTSRRAARPGRGRRPEGRSRCHSEKVINLATIQRRVEPQFQHHRPVGGEARELALLLRSGSLAAPIDPVEERAIGPSLGAGEHRQGRARAEIGMRRCSCSWRSTTTPSAGRDVVLLANVVLLTALLSMLRASLSLPGIAGIILTVGIAVDANVLIYERIREELRNGVSPQAAIRAGFDKAFSAIADSNVTALIAGLVLWVIGTGAIRGFAIVLTLGIATSMFTSLLGSRALITLMYGGRRKSTRCRSASAMQASPGP
jgi:preprotein translocase subunit SecD